MICFESIRILIYYIVLVQSRILASASRFLLVFLLESKCIGIWNSEIVSACGANDRFSVCIKVFIYLWSLFHGFHVVELHLSAWILISWSNVCVVDLLHQWNAWVYLRNSFFPYLWVMWRLMCRLFSCFRRRLQKRSLNGCPTKMHFQLLKHLLTCPVFNRIFWSIKWHPQCSRTAQVAATAITVPTALPS